ncbi:putative acetyltransferase [Paenibacillus sp. JGP012]|uniref:GNAT family N-acetyltransferase n=1 Tax=Paenibacillus sp. JGP012 TaxID=2735914 RepID=UPI00160A33CB|nr:GNAT family N-acetyltransferase [Paenibacillus sp. JGP012]MBB6024694.1 putative acetyltransferase [Paenibacillus sp. JGP012]
MISIEPVKYEQKTILRNLLELYKYDFSEFDPEDDINPNGLYEYKYVDHYFTEAERFAFFIKVEEKLAGFALVRCIGENEQNEKIYQMAEFFVMKKYRKLKCGQTVAFKLFNMFDGVWQVAEMETNVPAQKFWRKTIERYTHGNYTEIREADWDGPIQMFSSVKKAE